MPVTEVVEAPVEPTIENTFIKSKDIVQTRKLKMLVWSKQGLGKTYLALSAAHEPIYVISTEPESVEPLLVHFPDKDIRIVQCSKPYADAPTNKKTGVVDTEVGATDPELSLREFEKVTMLLKDIKEGTIVIDSISDLWEWFVAWIDYNADKYTQSGQMMRTEWGKVNSKYKVFINRLLSRPVDFIMTARSENLYVEGGKETTRTKMTGQKRTPYMPNIILELVQKPRPVIDTKTGKVLRQEVKTVGIIQKGRGLDLEAVGKEIERPTYEKLIKVLNEYGAGL